MEAMDVDRSTTSGSSNNSSLGSSNNTMALVPHSNSTPEGVTTTGRSN